MVLSAALAFAVILYLGRHLSTFLYDEWNVFINRQPWDVDTILRPHSEHLVAAPVLIFKLFFETVGASPYWPYRAAVALLVVVLGVLVYVFASPRIGKRAALVPGLLTVLVGQGGQDIIWPFQLSLGLSVLGAIAMLLCLDRGTPKSEWWAGGWIVLALASSSIGLAVLAAAAVDVLLHQDRARRALRMLALPVLLYGLWYANYNAAVLRRDNVLVAPQYAVEAAGGALGALLGLPAPLYAVLAVLFFAVVGWAWLRREPPPLRLLTIVTLPVAFWLLAAIGRAHDMQPAASRYLLPGAIFVALVICEALRGVRFAPRSSLLAAVLVAFATWSHVVALRAEAISQFDGFTSHVRAELAALALAREAGAVDRALRVDPVRAPDIVVGPYLEAVDEAGDPTPDPVHTLATSFNAPRESADVTYFNALRLGPTPSSAPPTGGQAPTVLAGTPRRSGRSCVIVGGRRTAVVALPPGGLALRTSAAGRADLRLRRWGSAFVPSGGLDAGGWSVLRTGRDRETRPVQVQIRGRGDVRVCTGGA